MAEGKGDDPFCVLPQPQFSKLVQCLSVNLPFMVPRHGIDPRSAG